MSFLESYSGKLTDQVGQIKIQQATELIIDFKYGMLGWQCKNTLAIIGIETEIVKVALPDGTLWHRVRIGPILDDQEYTEFKRILSKNGYKYLEIRSDN